MRGRICLSSPPTGLDAHSQKCAQPTVPGHALAPRPASHLAASTTEVASAHQRPRARHLAVQTISGGIGISTDCPSPTAFALGLGPTNPERINLPQETLDIRRARFSRAFRYSCRHSHFRPLQPSSRSAFTADGTLPYHRRGPKAATIRSFGTRLEPRWIFGAESLDQ
jgi:hypothetical protein